MTDIKEAKALMTKGPDGPFFILGIGWKGPGWSRRFHSGSIGPRSTASRQPKRAWSRPAFNSTALRQRLENRDP